MSNTQANYWWGIKQQNKLCYNVPPLFQGRCPKGGGINKKFTRSASYTNIEKPVNPKA